MKRWTILIMVATSLALATAPAAAKKPDPPDPPPPPELATVTLTLVDGADGLAGVLQMEVEASRNGKVEYFAWGDGESSPADLVLRGFEDYLDQGLHPGLAILEPNDCGDPAPYEGMFWLKFDRDGDLSDVMWHFDTDASWNMGRVGCSWVVNERYTIRALEDRELQEGEAPLTYSDGVVSGTFNLHLYDADAPEPHLDLGRTFFMQFELAIDG
jgi:hypothetical protein